MKVLYLAHSFNESDGWGNASLNYVLALNSVGIDVVPREVKLNNYTSCKNETIQALLKKSEKGCTHVIQHLLPHNFHYSGNFKKCIGLYATETLDWNYSLWPSYINMMDEAWVINQESKIASKDSGVKIPIHIVPHAFDLSKYQTQYPKFNIPDAAGNFKFYFIGTFNRRKNLATLLKSFYLEFDKTEPVSLILKVSGISNQELAKFCQDIKAGLRIGSCPNEVLITENLSEQEIHTLHQTCDCFVTATRGEAACLPAIEAAINKKPIIAPMLGMFNDFVFKLFLINVSTTNIIGQSNFPLYSIGHEQWYEIDSLKLRQKMRLAYNIRQNKEAIKTVTDKQFANVSAYSYERIGSLIKERLEND